MHRWHVLKRTYMQQHIGIILLVYRSMRHQKLCQSLRLNCLREWHQAIFSPSRMAFVTIGVEHELIKSVCERLFENFRPENSLNQSKAEYTGECAVYAEACGV